MSASARGAGHAVGAVRGSPLELLRVAEGFTGFGRENLVHGTQGKETKIFARFRQGGRD
jgi:hypothetical protein